MRSAPEISHFSANNSTRLGRRVAVSDHVLLLIRFWLLTPALRALAECILVPSLEGGVAQWSNPASLILWVLVLFCLHSPRANSEPVNITSSQYV